MISTEEKIGRIGCFAPLALGLIWFVGWVVQTFIKVLS